MKKNNFNIIFEKNLYIVVIKIKISFDQDRIFILLIINFLLETFTSKENLSIDIFFIKNM